MKRALRFAIPVSLLFWLILWVVFDTVWGYERYEGKCMRHGSGHWTVQTPEECHEL